MGRRSILGRKQAVRRIKKGGRGEERGRFGPGQERKKKREGRKRVGPGCKEKEEEKEKFSYKAQASFE